MAYELDSELRSGLQKQYHAMSDSELLKMMERLQDLTDMAQEVLRTEMQDRRLEQASFNPLPDPFGFSQTNVLPKPEFGTNLEPGKVSLTIFYDAIQAGEACRALDNAGIAFEVRDRSIQHSDMRSYNNIPVALEIVVEAGDRKRAEAILKEMLGVTDETAEPDAPVDDGTIATVGQFARRVDAEDVARVLTDAKIWNRITANPDGSVDTEDAFLVEVREVDLIKAGELVEKALNLPEA